jgi:hypothetical protein
LQTKDLRARFLAGHDGGVISGCTALAGRIVKELGGGRKVIRHKGAVEIFVRGKLAESLAVGSIVTHPSKTSMGGAAAFAF